MSVVTSNITIARFPKRHLAYLRHVGSYHGNSRLFESLYTKLMKWADPRGLMKTIGMEAITVYHDDPEAIPEEEQRISVGFTVPDGTQPDGDVRILEIPEGPYAIGTFEIRPNEYERAWGELFGFIMDEDLSPGRMMYESYKNDPRTHPEGKHVVDICVALQ